ncbi:MAG: hypothetical protein IRY94_21160, partial [Rhodospirillaceae bacterium]|nr:hypothetical protein [Rhodospirillaceae bacterium]
MNGSDAEASGVGPRGGRAPAALVLALVASLAAAGTTLPTRAQGPEEPVGPPTLLAPAGEAPAVPAPATPSAAVGGGAPGPEGGTAAPAPETGIAVQELGTAETDYGGPLQPGAGGFGLALWQGSQRARVTALLPRLPVSASPTMQQLARRLLLSAARPPEGPLDGPGLIGLRAERLFAMGRLDDARSLVAEVPSRYEDAAVGRVRLDLAWLARDLDRACAVVDAVSDPRQQDAYWQKSLIFCQLHRGQVREAQLGLELLREQGDDDPAFAALADRLAGGRGDVQPPAAP